MRFLNVIIILMVIALISCGKEDVTTDPCEANDCSENGICIEGICDCDAGFEGENCEIENRAKFLGLWKSEDYGCAGLNNAKVNFILEMGNNIFEILLSTDVNPEHKINGIYKNGIIQIPYQDKGTKYEGQIQLLEQDLILIELTIDNNICILDCTATAKKE